MKTQKPKCRRCGKSSGSLGMYVIADDLENLKAYHKKCWSMLWMEIIMQRNEPHIRENK